MRLDGLLAGRGATCGWDDLLAGQGELAEPLAELLAEHGDLDELRARTDAGDVYALAAGRIAGRARAE